MRRPETTAQLIARGITQSALRWRIRKGLFHGVGRGVYIEGPEPPTPVERALGVVVATNGIACESLAATLYELDAIRLYAPYSTIPLRSDSNRGTYRSDIAATTFTQGYECTTPARTLIDLARRLSRDELECALESALRKRLTTLDEIEIELKTKRHGNKAMRELLAVRPNGAPPTESLLETYMVQLIRDEPRLPEPTRQVGVFDEHGIRVARVDLAWPDLGIFIELDGEHHKDQPVYDARRETAVVAATGWLPGRFTWTEVTRVPKSTARRVLGIHAQARRRTVR